MVRCRNAVIFACSFSPLFFELVNPFYLGSSLSPVYTSSLMRQRLNICRMALFEFGQSNQGVDKLGTKRREDIMRNKVLNQKVDQYLRGAIAANDLIRSMEKGVAANLPGIDLEDVVEVALTMVTDPRRRSLLVRASKGQQSVQGTTPSSSGLKMGQRMVIEGERGIYMMDQGGQKISSGKSRIMSGAAVGKELSGQKAVEETNSVPFPKGSPLKFKVTSRVNAALALREVGNNSRVQKSNGTKTSSQLFVGFVEFLENYNGRGDSVMVMQAGTTDMRKLADTSGKGGVGKRQLRKYLADMDAIVRCIHKAGLVWCDLKLDNLVLCSDGRLRAIDLESAVPRFSPIVNFSPEATPPELALSFRNGVTPDLRADRSLDVWSLGMAILHLNLGKGYFAGYSNSQVLSTLCSQDFMVDLSQVEDGQTRSLLKGLLDPDPKKRLAAFDSPFTRLSLFF